MLLRTLAFISVLGAASFAQAGQLCSFTMTPTLGLTLASSNVSLVNSTGATCTKTPISSLRFDLGQAKIAWSNSAALEGSTIVIAFENANLKNGQYVCEITGAEFDAVFGTSGAAVAGNLTSISGCDLQCGGVQLISGAEAFTADATVTVLGTTQEGTIAKRAEHATVPLTIQYVP